MTVTQDLGSAEAAAGLTVHGAEAIDASAPGSTRAALIADDAPRRLAAKDATLWGPDAQAEATKRLGWVDTHQRSRELLPSSPNSRPNWPTSTTSSWPAWAARRSPPR